jgi:hypothetical protein
MLALVAMLLVATGGSARAAQSRTSVSTGQVSPPPTGGRQVAVVPLTGHDVVVSHLDLDSTPPTEAPLAPQLVRDTVADERPTSVPGDLISPVGRAPPTV